MATNEVEGYIIRVQKFKEKDAIISVLTNTGIKTIYGRGYKSIKSKYHVLNNLLLKIRLTGVQKKYFILQDFLILEQPKIDYGEYDMVSTLYNIIELIMRTQQEYSDYAKKYIYRQFVDLINNISKDNFNTLYYWFVGKILKANQITLIFDQCVACSKKENFSCFDFQSGGILCHDCMSKQEHTAMMITSVHEIKSINHLLNATILEVKEIKYSRAIYTGMTYLLNETIGIYTKEK